MVLEDWDGERAHVLVTVVLHFIQYLKNASNNSCVYCGFKFLHSKQNFLTSPKAALGWGWQLCCSWIFMDKMMSWSVCWYVMIGSCIPLGIATEMYGLSMLSHWHSKIFWETWSTPLFPEILGKLSVELFPPIACWRLGTVCEELTVTILVFILTGNSRRSWLFQPHEYGWDIHSFFVQQGWVWTQTT